MRKLSIGPTNRLVDLTRNIAGTWTISGRAAFGLILRHLIARGIKHVHLPAYLCESLLQPVRALGIDYSFYRVDHKLIAYPNPSLDSAVLLIHYFGWINPAAEELRAQSGNDFYLIEDSSQALLSDWCIPGNEKCFVLLSPRKFAPVPLGGWCNIELSLPKSSCETLAMMWRSIAARLAKGSYLSSMEEHIDQAIEDFYLSALQATESFIDNTTNATSLPHEAMKLISGIDWKFVSERRRYNWHILHDLLGDELEALHTTLPKKVVPLGYVININSRDTVRAQLAAKRIFCPVHWILPPEVHQQSFAEAIEEAKRCLTIPIDQRYGPDDMAYIANTIKKMLQML